MPQLLCVSNPNVYDRIDYADRSTICIVHVSLSDAFLRSIFKTQLFNVGTGVGTRVQVSLGGWTGPSRRARRPLLHPTTSTSGICNVHKLCPNAKYLMHWFWAGLACGLLFNSMPLWHMHCDSVYNASFTQEGTSPTGGLRNIA